MLTFGSLDLEDTSLYRFRESPPTEDRMEVVSPRSGSLTNQTHIVSRDDAVAWQRHFIVCCESRDAFDDLRDTLEETRLYWRTKGREGTSHELQRQVTGEITPDVWTVTGGRFLPINQELLSIPQWWVQLDLRCFEGSATAVAAPAPLVLRLTIPTPTLTSTTEITPAPVVLSLEIPDPTVS